MIFGVENSFWKSNFGTFWCGLAPWICKQSLKSFVLWLSVPHGTSNFVYPKIILHNRSHVIIHWFYQLPNVLQTRQTVEKLQSLISSDGRFRNLRDSLHRTDPPCIPYLGMYLSDLTFIEEGTPNFTDNGLLNFAKMRMVMFKLT